MRRIHPILCNNGRFLSITRCNVIREFSESYNQKKKSNYKINERKKLLKKVDIALKERDNSIKWAEEQLSLVNDYDKERISKMDFIQLKSALQKGEVKAELAVRVYLELALKSHNKTNCLTLVIKDCIDRAKSLDELAKDPNYKKPPLFGMPLSVKESIGMKGIPNTWGCSKLLDNIPTEDHYIIEKLIASGMIPFVMTNIPISCMTYNCDNGIWGQTTNPYNRDRTPGGSSGGEGALIGSNGSLIGIGSDLAGSARVPAAYSGCVGFKPTSTRLSYAQISEPVPGRPFVLPTEGIMAQSPQAIVDLLRCLWEDEFMHKKDAYSVPVNFREHLYKPGQKYRIGYYTTDGYVEPVPGVQRVVIEAVKLLEAKGHTVIPFTLNDIPSRIVSYVSQTMFADGGEHIYNKLKGEIIPPSIKPMIEFLGWSLFRKRSTGYLLKLFREKTVADIMLSIPKTAKDVHNGVNGLFGCRKEMIQKMKNESIDAILCPATISPAVSHIFPNEIPMTTIVSTFLWNAMDFPAGVAPMGTWTEDDESNLEKYKTIGFLEKNIKKMCKNSVGLPLSVQLVAPPYRDELALRLMCDLYDATQKK